MSGARIPVVVRSAQFVARDVRQLALARLDGGALPAFTPGAHVDLHLGAGLVRQYSLCSSADDRSAYVVAVKLEPQSRGGSRVVHEGVEPGVHLEISAPRNHFPLTMDAPHSVLVAGGIGVTPLLCMARALAANGRSFTLHHFARSREQAAFFDVLGAPPFARDSRFHLGLGRQETAAALSDALAHRSKGALLYLCGPGAFMDLVLRIAGDSGWPHDAVHLEHFGAGEPVPASGDRDIDVTLARSGVTVPVPAGVSVIDALRSAGVCVDSSCEQGVCGACVTRVLEGMPEHRDLFLTGAEKAAGDCMALCVSRAVTPSLVLDL